MLNKLHCDVTETPLTSRVMTPQGERKKEEKRLEFGQWLQSRRVKAGFPLGKQFAPMIDISSVQLSRIENGTSGISAETLDKAIELLSLNAVEAYDKAGLMPPGFQAQQQEPAETVEEVLRNAFLFGGKPFSDEEIAQLRPYMEMLDREIDRVRALSKQAEAP